MKNEKSPQCLYMSQENIPFPTHKQIRPICSSHFE